MAKVISFQGERGANSEIACNEVFPDWQALPCATFEDAFAALADGTADLAMIPIDNSIAGRVGDIHHLLPTSGFHIIGEHFLPIHFHLMAIEGASLATLTAAQSHVMALGQCRRMLKKLNLKAIVAADTAGSARQVRRCRTLPAPPLLPALLQRSMASRSWRKISRMRTTTPRGSSFSRGNNGMPCRAPARHDQFRLPGPQRSGRALQGFGRVRHQWRQHGEARELHDGGQFTATQFYADVEGHPDDLPLKRALEELEFFSKELRILGTYPAHPYRAKVVPPAE